MFEFDLAGHADMLSDPVRVGAYARDVVFAQPLLSPELYVRSHGFGPVEGVAVDPLRPVLAQLTPEVADYAVDARPLFEIRHGAPLSTRYAGQAELVADGKVSETDVDARVVELARRRQARVVRRLGPA